MVTFDISFRCIDEEENIIHQVRATSDCVEYTKQNFADEGWLESQKAFIADEVWYIMDRSLETFHRIIPNSVNCIVVFPDSTSLLLCSRIINATHITTL